VKQNLQQLLNNTHLPEPLKPNSRRRTMERQALKLALEALEDLSMKHFENTGQVLYKETYAIVEAALAQPAQKPVACKTLCELCVKRGYNFCANAVKTTPIATPPKREWEEWNAALDAAASRIGEIKSFGQATQDSFAVFIQGLKK